MYKRYWLILSFGIILLTVTAFRVIEESDEPPLIVPTPTNISHPIAVAITPIATVAPVPTASVPATLESTPTTQILTPALTASSDIEHVVIISVDGLRPDAIDLAESPTFDTLRANGAYSPNAQTILPSITLPSHASMLTGMTPEKHGIVWGLPYIGWPGMAGPTIFSLAHEQGLSTTMIYGKEKFGHLVLENSVDEVIGGDAHDPEIKDGAIKVIEAGLPDVLFIHFPDTDRVGHAYGWLSPNQLFAVTFVDNMISEIVESLKKEGYFERTLLIITADHGGHDKVHGDDNPEDLTIPWLAVGPGVRSGVIISQPITTYDTAATTAHVLKLPRPEKWDGRPVMEIFE